MKKFFSYIFIVFAFFFIFNFNAKAYTIATYNNIVMDEDFIYTKFKSIDSNFSFNEFDLVHCVYFDKFIYEDSPELVCTALRSQDMNNFTLISNEVLEISTPTPLRRFYYRPSYDGISRHDASSKYGSFSFYSNNYKLSSMSTHAVTNFTTLNDDSYIFNSVLNFEKYTLDLKLNESLFSNDENFKKVCVDSDFSITKTPSSDVLYENDYDYIWFPYGMSGIKQFNYSTTLENGYHEFDDPYKNYYFSSYEKINSIWSNETSAENFISKGYTNKYDYFGYTAYMFLHWYDFQDGQTFNFFPIFVLENPTITHISSSGNTHGGGGLRLDDDEEIELTNEYCFYIKNEYEVNEVNLDEWGDYYTSVNTPNGSIDYNTSVNKDNTSTDSFLSQPIKFISEMSGTIVFINTFIYNFYLSMPLIVRTFLITALIILMVILIMKIGGYK